MFKKISLLAAALSLSVAAWAGPKVEMQTSLGRIVIELDDARWFSREDALKLVEGRLDGFFCPPKFAIAHQLIASWARGETS